MSIKRRQFTKEFKEQVLREIAGAKTQAAAGREYEIAPHTIAKWRKQARKYGERAFAGQGRAYTDEAKIGELERMIGQLAMENALLKKVLARLEEEAGWEVRRGGRR